MTKSTVLVPSDHLVHGQITRLCWQGDCNALAKQRRKTWHRTRSGYFTPSQQGHTIGNEHKTDTIIFLKGSTKVYKKG